MPRYFASISKEELKNKILNSVEEHGELDDYYEQNPTHADYHRGTDGDKEVGLLGAVARWSWKDISPQVKKDLSKVEFDLENVMLGKSYKYSFKLHSYTHELDPTDKMNPLKGLVTFNNGFTFLGLQAGGDWEYPVFFIIYWDGKKLRGYIPKNGNLYNSNAKMAYGNNCEEQYEVEGCQSDEENCEKRFGISLDFAQPGPSLIEADIKSRIQVKP